MTPRGPKTPRFDSSDRLFDVRIAAELDLHGVTTVEVESVVRGFLAACQRRAPGSVVRIITGKGRNSPGAPALLPRVRTLLKGALARYVADWARSPDEGGYLVLIR